MSKYALKDHIIARDGIHGVIVKITSNHWGPVYCILKKDWPGRACINESDVVGVYGDNRVISDGKSNIP